MRFAVAPSNAKDRFEIYRFYNGISGEGKEGLDQGRSRVPLVKTFLLEHVSRDSGQPKPVTVLFAQMGAELKQVDESFFSVTAEVTNGQTVQAITGFLEPYDERFFAYYTNEDSNGARKRVAKWAQHPDLDRAWFSSPLLQQLWNKDVSNRGDQRFGKLVFKHESIFEMPADSAEETLSAEDEDLEGAEPEDDNREPDRRKARFEMKDRIGQVRNSLAELQKNYDPLNALYALRLPSLAARGGHDLYLDGQVTNRSNSFEDHRNHVRYLYRIYREVLRRTEKAAWHAMSDSQHPSRVAGTRGEPLIVKFSEPLPKTTFDRWVSMAFQKRNRFKLWGDPIILGPTKVHVYGADRHLWQPINLELTAEGVVAVLPVGTCGNTFHRLVANIQHYVSPKIKAWIGSEPFEKVVGGWPAGIEVADDAR